MWVELKTHDSSFVVLPYRFNANIKKIKFGSINVNVNAVNSLSNLSSLGDYLTIKIPSKVKDKLNIDTDIKYQYYVKDEILYIGPLVGILLNKQRDLNKKRLGNQLDRLGIYKNIGGLTCAFTTDSIDFDNLVVSGYYFKPNVGWVAGVFPLPDTIYRRYFNPDKKLFLLMKISNVFNPNEIELNVMDESINKVILKKEKLVNLNIIKELDKMKKVRLISNKDNLKSYILEKVNNKYYLENSISLRFNSKRKLLKFIRNNKIYLNYSIQQYFDKTTIEGQDYMLRVVVQKGYSMSFTVTGIEVISSMDYSLLDTLIKSLKITKDEASKLIDRIEKVCINTVETIDKKNEFVEFALKVILDKNKKVWLVDIDTRPNFLSFIKYNYYTYLNMRYQPLIYATKLSGFKLLDEI